MPERKTGTRKVQTGAVQGKGSWVIFKALTWGETREMAKWAEGTNEEAAKEIEEFLTGKLLDWNWVDDKGEPLPLPKSGKEWMDPLTKEEVEFLMDKATD